MFQILNLQINYCNYHNFCCICNKLVIIISNLFYEIYEVYKEKMINKLKIHNIKLK